MASVPTTKPKRKRILSPLMVSTYEMASGLLIALLFLVGTATALVFIIWLTTVLDFSRRMRPVRMIEYPGRGDHAAGFARDMDPPGLEELEEVLEEPQLEAALEAVTDVASTVAAARDALQTESAVSSAGKGQGDSRPPGPLGEGENVIPPWERWEMRFESTSIAIYAQQIDHFKIEVAAIGGAPLVDYARNLSKSKPDTRQGESKTEKRIYMTWKNGKLREFDRRLLTKAGIKVNNRIVMQFIPEDLYKLLHQLEFNNTERDPKEWLKTIFGLKKRGAGWEFFIIDQHFRPPPP